MMKLRINPEVIEDIAEIKRYIREELYNPSAADRTAKRIVSAYKELKTAPYIGAPLDSVLEVKTDYRFLVCGNHLIFYKVKDDVISIYRVMNGRRDYCRQLFGMSYTQISDDEEVSAISEKLIEQNCDAYEKLK